MCKRRCIAKSVSVSINRTITGQVELLEEDDSVPHPTLPPLFHAPDESPLRFSLRSLSPLGAYPFLGKAVFLPHIVDNNEHAIQETALRVLVSCNQFYVFFFSSFTPEQPIRRAILRSLPSDTAELSYLLSSQLLVNYEEEKKLFLADDPLERITLANSLCRVGVMACSEE